MPNELDRIIREQDASIESLVSAFEQHLAAIVQRASATTTAQLAAQLTYTPGGKIARTLANQRILRRLDSIFLTEMDAAGFGALVNAFIQQFPGQIQFFYQIFEELSKAMKNTLPPVKFGTADTQYFASQGTNAADMIRGAVEAAAVTAKQQALFNIAGLDIKTLTAQLVEKLQLSVPRAAALADTAVSTFYRTVAERGYQIAEKDLPANSILYTYLGPLDKRNRPFCRALKTQARAGKTWTREQIDGMDNGMLPNVFITCGGWRCRHQWGISGLKVSAQAA